MNSPPSTPPDNKRSIASKAQIEMIDACGRVSQIVGFPRTTGQIYGLLYFSIKPICLEEIAEDLGISKASSSLGTRELLSWRAIRQVWVHGDRRARFEIELDLADLLRSAYRDLVKPRINSSKKRLDALNVALCEDLENGRISPQDHKIFVDRLKRFQQLQRRIQTLILLGEKVL